MSKKLLFFIILTLFIFSCMDYDSNYIIPSSFSSDNNTDDDDDPIADDDDTTSTSYQNLYGITYANSKFIAVGNKGRILYSDNGSSWDNGTSGINTRLNEVTYASSISKYVAVGHSGKIIYSSNGSSWDNATWDKTSTIYGIAYKSSTNYLNIVGSGNAAYSTNGSSWTTVTSGTLYDACQGGGTFLGVGTSGDIDYSTNNGVGWSDANNIPTNKTLYGCAYGNSTWIVVGRDGSVLKSTGHEDWSGSLTNPTSLSLYSVIYAGSNKFVSVGYKIVMSTSNGGSSWDIHNTSLTFYDITYGNSLYVAVTTKEKIYTSTDLSTWTKVHP